MARTFLGKALKSYGRSLSLWAWGIFHQTVINTFDNKRRNRVDSKWQMRERKDAATEGEEREDDVPTEPWLTLTANSTNTCVLSIGKPNVCYLRTFITAGASFSAIIRLMFHHRKWEKEIGFIVTNVIWMWNGFHCPSTVYFNISPLLIIYPSLIKSYLQAWGRHQDNQYAICPTFLNAPPSLSPVALTAYSPFSFLILP